MKNHIMNVLKGIAIGIANVIPGFSGGTMAVMVKIYDLFVYAFANFFNDSYLTDKFENIGLLIYPTNFVFV